jgi:hypothetical protein
MGRISIRCSLLTLFEMLLRDRKSGSPKKGGKAIFMDKEKTQ